MLKVYVINLPESRQRWNKTSSRLRELGVIFERFEAVDGRINSHPLFERYDDKLREKHRRVSLSGGELGCFASHFKLWEKCVELDHPIVVMEDDILIHDSLQEALSIAECNQGTYHYLRFSGINVNHRPFKRLKPMGSFELVDHIKGPAGTQCYFLTPEAAKRFLKHAKVWYLAVDDYMDRYWRNGVACFSLLPYPVIRDDVKTDMDRRPKTKRTLLVKMIKETYALGERMRRLKYRLKQRM